jgi:tetratricopeptide (TPR) repeat protein
MNTLILLLALTTSGDIAVRNLDFTIARNDTKIEELLLMRARFLSDYDALDRAVAMTENAHTRDELLRRARTRAAVHRFSDALDDLAAAERLGADARSQRTMVLIAMGRAEEVVPHATGLELAAAYGDLGRVAEADQLYAAALDDLQTTSPFPFAWLYFVRGNLWADHGDAARAEEMYVRALDHLPQFVTASVHLAELEAGRGDVQAAIARLTPLTSSNEPEVLALLGELHVRTGDRERGLREIESARARYESLLAKHPLAFADHAAEFYLGPGNDPQRASKLAQQNLAARRTKRAIALVIRAANAVGCPDHQQ